MPHVLARMALTCLLPLVQAPVSPPAHRPAPAAYDFAFVARGGITLTASGEAQFGMVDPASELPRFFSLTLGTAGEAGAIVFSRLSPDLPLAGKYAVRPWGVTDPGASFQAAFFPGTAANPRGVFRAESGTVTIRHTAPGVIEGTFTLKARGFLAENPDNENVSVTIHGTFAARGGSMIAQVSAVN